MQFGCSLDVVWMQFECSLSTWGSKIVKPITAGSHFLEGGASFFFRNSSFFKGQHSCVTRTAQFLEETSKDFKV